MQTIVCNDGKKNKNNIKYFGVNFLSATGIVGMNDCFKLEKGKVGTDE